MTRFSASRYNPVTWSAKRRGLPQPVDPSVDFGRYGIQPAGHPSLIDQIDGPHDHVTGDPITGDRWRDVFFLPLCVVCIW